MNEQETLEEAVKKLYPTTIDSFTDTGVDVTETERLIFINGAKWQQEKSYSEKEMLDILIEFQFKTDIQHKQNPVCVVKWFEHFKKK